MNRSIGADTVTVQRAPLSAADRYGKQFRDWSALVAHTVAGVSVQPISAAEAVVDREYAAAHMVMYAPAGSDIIATDRVVWRGTTFEVDGPSQRWVDDAGNADHDVVTLKLMTG